MEVRKWKGRATTNSVELDASGVVLVKFEEMSELLRLVHSESQSNYQCHDCG